MSEGSEAGRLKSPPFPSVPLAKAIDRAAQIYQQERDHLVPVASAARAWTMSPTSSGPIQMVGALRQYGLITDEGAGASRKIKLTPDALRIILEKGEVSAARSEAIKRCFLNPKIFAELWEKWKGDLPSDQTMVNYLVLERRLMNLAPYSDQGAIELLGNYRSSMAFAATMGGDTIREPDDAPVEDDTMHATDNAPASSTGGEKRTSPRPPVQVTEVALSAAERVVFTEEGDPGQQVKVVLTGPLSEDMLDALSAYVSRQKKRLARTEPLN